MKNIEKRIEKTFLQLLIENDLDAITVSMITTKANMSRTSFYNYYESVEMLLGEITNNILIEVSMIFDSWEYINIERLDYQSALPMYSKSFQYVKENQIAFRALFGVHGKLDFIHKFQHMINKRMKAKFMVDKISDSKLEFKLAFIVGGLTNLVMHWLEDIDGATADEMAVMAAKMSLYPIYH